MREQFYMLTQTITDFGTYGFSDDTTVIAVSDSQQSLQQYLLTFTNTKFREDLESGLCEREGINEFYSNETDCMYSYDIVPIKYIKGDDVCGI